jgi:hypothetical protein
MKPDYNLCDRCGAITELPMVSACVDRNMDPSGSMEYVFESFDVCGKCAVHLLQTILKYKDSYDYNREVINEAKKTVK